LIVNEDIMYGQELLSKRIGICVTGSIAAIRSPEISRELIKYGANVISIMSKGSQKFIKPELMQWATQNDVITSITSKLEHIRLTEGPQKLDLIIIAPATANTISKVASGISDTTVTLLVSCAIGYGIPLIVAPSMHLSLLSNPIVKSNLEALRKLGITILDPIIEEGKAKITHTDTIVESVISRLYIKDLMGLKVLVTAGPTYEYLDPIRIITNKSSGKMGVALAREALRRGAKVTLVSGPTSLTPPLSTDFINVETTKQMQKAVVSKLKNNKYNIFIGAAAPEDFKVINPSKIKLSSRINKKFNIKFETNEKIINLVKKINENIFIVAFKAETGLSRSEMIKNSKIIINESKANFVALNDISVNNIGFGEDTNQMILVKENGPNIVIPKSSKMIIAKIIFDKILIEIKEKNVHTP